MLPADRAKWPIFEVLLIAPPGREEIPVSVFVLVGDIGGTNCRLALFRGSEEVFERTYPSQEQSGLDVAVEHFLEEARKTLGADVRPQRACFGVAGPVEND